ncbi:hypothetical protein CJU94_10370 [Paraburkholderia aromaticivorans]|uniref:Uncharacterized protein n=1 Tax=Paraburkholderia aromaticivorans TaxID=2026199 RepID=A0A248VMS8_9BURK|nr:hypothetical protein CJU94_10370 [Paraburkholderia aromaticivorans]
MVASHAIYRELYCHGVRRISGTLHATAAGAEAPIAIDTKKRQLNAAFLPSRENVKRADRHAKRQVAARRETRSETINRSSS